MKPTTSAKVASLIGLSLAFMGYGALAQTVSGDQAISTHTKRVSSQVLPTPSIDQAPKSDFERVAWCHGILSGHMEMAVRVHEEDEVMKTIGQSYLKTYEAALTLSAEGQTDAGRALAEKARDTGFHQWDEASKASIDKQTGAYLNWSLPGDCERAAVTISGHPNLFEEMATAKESETIAETLKPLREKSALKTLNPKSAPKDQAPSVKAPVIPKPVTPKPGIPTEPLTNGLKAEVAIDAAPQSPNPPSSEPTEALPSMDKIAEMAQTQALNPTKPASSPKALASKAPSSKAPSKSPAKATKSDKSKATKPKPAKAKVEKKALKAPPLRP